MVSTRNIVLIIIGIVYLEYLDIPIAIGTIVQNRVFLFTPISSHSGRWSVLANIMSLQVAGQVTRKKYQKYNNTEQTKQNYS